MYNDADNEDSDGHLLSLNTDIDNIPNYQDYFSAIQELIKENFIIIHLSKYLIRFEIHSPNIQNDNFDYYYSDSSGILSDALGNEEASSNLSAAFTLRSYSK